MNIRIQPVAVFALAGKRIIQGRMIEGSPQQALGIRLIYQDGNTLVPIRLRGVSTAWNASDDLLDFCFEGELAPEVKPSSMAVMVQDTTSQAGVFQFMAGAEADIDELLSKLISLPLSGVYPDWVAVADLNIASEQHSCISRLVGSGRVMKRQELLAVLDGAFVNSGWFFIGVNEDEGKFRMPIDLKTFVAKSAFVVDVIEGSLMGVRTVWEDVAADVRELVSDLQEYEPCEIGELKLMY